jgi:serine beta-lactamase-like protein LACTB, mitochondrial
MKRRSSVVARLLCCGFLIGGAAPGAANSADAGAVRVADRILAALVETNGVPGMGAAVWRNGRVIWSGSAGYRDVEKRLPVDSDTVFRFASVSKLFAATAAARLRERGALDADKPVQEVLGPLNPQWPPITPRQLAAHIAGIPHYQPIDADRGGRHFTSVAEAIDVFRDRALLAAPGTAYKYSSYGYTLLSAIVEKAAGKPYLDYLSGEITPGLTIGPDQSNTGNPAATIAYEHAQGAMQPAAPHDFSYSWGGAGLGGTAPDLARWGGRLLDGRLVSKATFEWMIEPARTSDGATIQEDGSTIGFGWRSGRDSQGERTAHHAGVTTGARSILLLYPDSKMAVSVLSNALWVSSIELTALTLARPFRQQPSAARAPACPISATRYEGIYDGKAISGSARFEVRNGVCTASIDMPDAIRETMAGSTHRSGVPLQIVSFDHNARLTGAALVTPIGAYELMPDPQSGEWRGRIGQIRPASFRFLPAGA